MANLNMIAGLDPIITMDNINLDDIAPATTTTDPLTQPDNILGLIEEIKHSALQEQISSSPETHFQLLSLIDQLRLAVETPTETVLRLIYQPPQNAALRVVVDLGIFPLLVNNGRMSAGQLAVCTGAERALIIRLMRVMTALGLCACVEPEVYVPNEKTAIMTQPTGKDGVPCIYDLTVPTLAKLPEYFKSNHYVSPKDYSRSPMAWAVGQGQFEWLADLDIGGNQGHDIVKFHERYPSVPGRLVLQDLPDVVSCAEPGVEAMGYNFLNPQPVKGARTYYFRSTFHDWPDRVCHQILQNTVAAMDPEYSRIIIVDLVLSDTNAPLLQASLDIQMMSIGAGVERSEQQWRELLHRAGLEIKGVWNFSPGMESVIEAVRVKPSELAKI